MSAYTAARVEKPEYWSISPLMRGRGKRVPYIIGYDSEADTTTGKAMMLQFSLPGWDVDDGKRDGLIVLPDEPHAAVIAFLTFLFERCTDKSREYLVYGFNLQYEFAQFFRDSDESVRQSPYWESDTLSFTVNGKRQEWVLKVAADKRFYMTMTNVHTKRNIRLLDAYAFYKTSLAKAAKLTDAGDKYHDESVDRTRFTRADIDDDKFRTYAATDALVTRKIGEQIIAMHEQYDVRTCISAPHFASSVFRRRFLTTTLDALPEDLEQAGLWSYHGGKNGYYLDGPEHIDRIHAYDITSAYPEAMRQLPDIERARWHEVDDYQPGRHAIYRVTLRYRRCTYRGFQEYDGKWPQSGITEGVHVTSYELDAMVERGECDIIAIHGWVMTGPSGGPLREYVDEFFAMKATTTGPERETAKLFLNSLYGKFFQKVPVGRVGYLSINLDDPDAMEWVETDPEEDYDWRAGGLYHPPIASLITGYVRAKIHRLEHAYHSIMTSTDGIFGRNDPVQSDIGTALGMLTVQAGTLDIWRERLYIFDADDGKDKAALHGFRGDADLLRTIPLAPGAYTYEAQQMVTLKLSTKVLGGKRHAPGTFVTLPFTIAIDGPQN